LRQSTAIVRFVTSRDGGGETDTKPVRIGDERLESAFCGKGESNLRRDDGRGKSPVTAPADLRT